MMWLSVVIHAVVVAYAVRAVCVRMRLHDAGRDRRVLKADHIKALQFGFVATGIALVFALISQKGALWDWFSIMSVVVACLAVRVLEHERRTHSRKTEVRGNSADKNQQTRSGVAPNV